MFLHRIGAGLGGGLAGLLMRVGYWLGVAAACLDAAGHPRGNHVFRLSGKGWPQGAVSGV